MNGNEDAPQDHLLDDGMDGINNHEGNQSPNRNVSRLNQTGGQLDIFAEGFKLESQLPYRIEIMGIPRMSEVKTIWH